MASILELAKKLNKEFKDEHMITKSDVVPEYTRFSTGALGMDYPLYGGLPYGRICVYSGQAHSGKTTAACCELAAYQRENPDKVCIYVDVEHSLDIQHQVRMNHIDQDKMYYFNPTTLSGEQILDAVIELQKADDVGLIVIDSIPALLPAKVLENDLSKDMGKQGTIAKTLHKFLIAMSSMVNAKGNVLILINQVRVKDVLYNGAPVYSEPGGDAPKYYSSVSVRFGKRTYTKGDDMDACKPDGEGADGFRLKFQITKNKTCSCARGGGFLTYRYDTGLDYMHDLLEIALKFEFIQRINNITYALIDLETGEVLNDENGNPLKAKKADLIEYILTHDAFRKFYMDMLLKHISASDSSFGNLLSSEESSEILLEENVVGGNN